MDVETGFWIFLIGIVIAIAIIIIYILLFTDAAQNIMNSINEFLDTLKYIRENFTYARILSI